MHPDVPTGAPLVTSPAPSSGGALFIVQCGLYMASLIIGAGILGLPTLTATVGLIPAVGMTIALGLAMTAVYVRISRSIRAAIRARLEAHYALAAPVLQRAGLGHDALPDLHRHLGSFLLDRKGAGIFDAVCAWLGFGRAGSTVLMTGLIAFVMPALTLYITIGGGALVTMARFLNEHGVPVLAIAVTATAGFLMVARTSRRPPVMAGGVALVALTQMVSSWLVAIVVLMLVTPGTTLGVLLFGAAIAGLVFRTGPQVSTAAPRPPDQMEPAHQLGAIITIINVTLLLLTGALSLLMLRSQGALAAPALFAPSIDFGDVAKTGGGLLFAYTGTGVFNLVRYPSLFADEPHAGKSRLGSAVILGTVLATVAYAGWMTCMAFAVTPGALLQADNDRSYATVPLARSLAEHGPAGTMVFVSGYAVALLAVTSAGIGFSESLAERLARLHGATAIPRASHRIDPGDLPGRERIRQAQLGILALTTGAALLVQGGGSGFAYRDILSVAGYAGGGLLLLVLPFFIPADGRARALTKDVVLATAIALSLAMLNVLELPPGFGHTAGDTAAGIVVIGVTILFLASFLWLLVGHVVSHSPGTGEERPW